MLHEPYILLVEAEVLPQFTDQVAEAAQQTLKRTLNEPGCLSFHQTHIAGEPGKFVFFEVFASEKAHDHHQEQDYTKQFFATLDGKLVKPPRVTHLHSLQDPAKASHS